MSTIPLPERPNLEQLKKRAKEIAREFGIPLHEAQLNMARGHGFPSWPKLANHIEVVTKLTRTPDLVEASTDPVDEFLRRACLTYGHNDSAETTRPAAEIATANIWAAAATASTDAAERFVSDATTQGGPFRWEPLMYLCYSRIGATESDVLATARVLLDAGADPNVGYLWHGLSTPFTALTGVFGDGEGGQPEHPHWQTLARLLLDRGANANDPQTLYNRQFRPGTTHLELLFEYGLGEGDGGPWQALMNGQMETIPEMLERQMSWARRHDMSDRVELLAAHGVPVGTTKSPRSELDEVIALAATDTAAAIALRPALLVQASALARYDDVRRLVELGWHIDALGRSDVFSDEPWQTALHSAVEHNDAAMVELLLQLGADPSIEDARFHATPKGWAEHFGNAEIAARLS